MIEDGGPNDADGSADGTVTDPSGIATLYFGPPSADSTITISVGELKAGGSETAEVVVTAVDVDRRNLEGMTITATASLADATISSFTKEHTYLSYKTGVNTITMPPKIEGDE